MRILMLAWEFPPKIVGGLARHVDELSTALVKAGHDVHVITADSEGSPEFEIFKGIKVHRVKTFRPKSIDFLGSIYQLNLGILDYAISLVRDTYFDVIHCHDWLVADAGIALKRAFGTNLVSTIHATERGRWQGIHNEMQTYINDMEWLLTYESKGVIVCSDYMKREVQDFFGLPSEKVFILPNGIEMGKFNYDFDHLELRRRFAMDHEKIVMSVGRMVPEKGFQVLIDAAAKVYGNYNDVRFVISGKGGMLENLRSQAYNMGLGDKVLLTGFMDDDTLNKLFIVSDIAVFPSLYEPFGITAIEAMAAGTPIVVSDTGGLSEIVDHGHTGIKTYTGNSDSLAWGILELLFNPEYANKIRENAYNKVSDVYDWDKIAFNTLDAYQKILNI